MSKSFLGSKKGQGMSLNTVIIAIIVLIVLVVLVMIFTGYFGRIFTPSVKSCSSQGGECAAACNTGTLGTEIYGAECSSKDLKCCSRVGTTFEREEGVASCTTQGGSCEANTKTDPLDTTPPIGTVPATCADYGKAAFSAPGCSSGKICCK